MGVKVLPTHNSTTVTNVLPMGFAATAIQPNVNTAAICTNIRAYTNCKQRVEQKRFLASTRIRTFPGNIRPYMPQRMPRRRYRQEHPGHSPRNYCQTSYGGFYDSGKYRRTFCPNYLSNSEALQLRPFPKSLEPHLCYTAPFAKNLPYGIIQFLLSQFLSIGIEPHNVERLK